MSSGHGQHQWAEWGVRRTWGPTEGEIAEFGRDRKTAAQCADSWPGELVSRVVTAAEWGAVTVTNDTMDQAVDQAASQAEADQLDSEMPYEFVGLTQQRTATAARLVEHFPHGYVCGGGQCRHNLNSQHGWAAHVAEVLHPDPLETALAAGTPRPRATRARR